MHKTVWISGASSGIGRALAIEFNRVGFTVILSSRNQIELEKTASLCLENYPIEIFPMDLESNSDFINEVQSIINFYGRVDIAILNAGISQRDTAANTTINTTRRIMELNFFANVKITKAFLPYFLAQKSGQFVLVSSVVGFFGTPLRSSYSASKHACHGFFEALRAELASQNISVTLLCPGYVQTNLSYAAVKGDGMAQNRLDKGQANGIQPTKFAKRAVKKIVKQQSLIIVAGTKERLGLVLHRFFPKILEKMLVRINVR